MTQLNLEEIYVKLLFEWFFIILYIFYFEQFYIRLYLYFNLMYHHCWIIIKNFKFLTSFWSLWNFTRNPDFNRDWSCYWQISVIFVVGNVDDMNMMMLILLVKRVRIKTIEKIFMKKTLAFMTVSVHLNIWRLFMKELWWMIIWKNGEII